MDELKMREIAKQVYAESQTQGQFSPIKIPVHTHNGIDNQRISARNLIYNNKVVVQIIAEAQAITQTTLNIGVFNPTSIKSFGIARNNLAGAAIKKTVYSGDAELGLCFSVSSATSINTIPQNIVQLCSGTEFDNTSGAWVPTVFTAGISTTFPTGLLAASDSSGTDAYIRVVSFSNNSITFESYANADWRITCNLIIT